MFGEKIKIFASHIQENLMTIFYKEHWIISTIMRNLLQLRYCAITWLNVKLISVRRSENV